MLTDEAAHSLRVVVLVSLRDRLQEHSYCRTGSIENGRGFQVVASFLNPRSINHGSRKQMWNHETAYAPTGGTVSCTHFLKIHILNHSMSFHKGHEPVRAGEDSRHHHSVIAWDGPVFTGNNLLSRSK